MLASLPYMVLLRLLTLGAPNHRFDDAALIEILVLRHQLHVYCPVELVSARASQEPLTLASPRGERGQEMPASVLRENRAVADRFYALHGDQFVTVRGYYETVADRIEIVEAR